MLVIEFEKHWYKECATRNGNKQSSPFLLDISKPTVQGTEAQYNKDTSVHENHQDAKATSSPSRQGPNLFATSYG